MTVAQPADQRRAIECAHYSTRQQPEHFGQVWQYGSERHGTAADCQREGERDQACQKIERYGGSRIEADPVHQHRQPELAATEPDQPAKPADGHAPSKRAPEIRADGGTDHWLPSVSAGLIVTGLGRSVTDVRISW